MVSASKPSNIYSDQQVLMGALPLLLLKDKSLFDSPPKFYLRSRDTSQTLSPPQRMNMPTDNDLLHILKINNIDLASIVPKIEFYKIVRDKSGKKVKEIFIPYAYDARKYAENIYGNKEQRGDDVGITNVSFVYDEQNPAVAETLLGCTVDFVFANAAALVTERNRGQVTKGKKSGFRFADLFAFAFTESSELNDKDKYDIILKVGYQLDGVVQTLSADVTEALKKQERIIQLGMIDYDLQFSENGMLKVSVQYQSANVNFFSSRRNEIFGARRLTKKSKNINAATRTPDEDKEAIDLQALYSGIQTYMAENCMIQKLDAALIDELASGEFYFSKNPCFASGQKNDFKEDISGQLIGDGAGSVEDVLNRFKKEQYEGKRTITYFYFGDLLDAILATNPDIVEEMKSRKFAFLLDNVGYQFLKGGQISIFNIAKLPISQSIFNEWFSKDIVAADKKVMSLLNFVKTYVLKFALGILRIQVSSAIGSDYFPNLVRRLISVPNGLLDNKGISGFTNLSPIKGKSFYAKESDSSFYEYYTIYDEKYYSDILSAQMDVIDEADRYYFNLAAGVPHFYIGADRGLLETLSFKKSSLGEEIAVQRYLEGSPYQQLWAIFDVDATFIGNNLMSVGKNIYIDPTITGLGSPLKKGTVANIMGLGGYYMVTRVEHNYYPKWKTKISGICIVPASQQKAYITKGAVFAYF